MIHFVTERRIGDKGNPIKRQQRKCLNREFNPGLRAPHNGNKDGQNNNMEIKLPSYFRPFLSTSILIILIITQCYDNLVIR